nr:hypothetical protein [Sphingopyxis sp.]
MIEQFSFLYHDCVALGSGPAADFGKGGGVTMAGGQSRAYHGAKPANRGDKCGFFVQFCAISR